MHEKTKEMKDVSNQIKPILAGHPPEIQAAVLADLMAMWLAGHQGPPDEIEEFRNKILDAHITLIRRLVPINEKMILERIKQLKMILERIKQLQQ